MKKLLVVITVALIAPSLFAQDWRDRPYRRSGDNAFEITPFAGYRWGGTIYADRNALYGQDVDVESSGSYGVDVGIPIASNGLKLELMVNRQDTSVTSGGGIFLPSGTIGDFHITHYHAGVLIPFNRSRSLTPFFVVSAGVASLDPATAGFANANRFSASAGLGVKVPLGSNLALRLEGRGYATSMSNHDCSRCYSYDDNRDLYQGEVNAGLTVRF